VEILEIVGVGKEMQRDTLVEERMLYVLGKKWKGLRSVKASVLKKKVEQWIRDTENGAWKKQAG